MSADAAASVKARLLNEARARGAEFEWMLARFAAERLLFRLGESSARDRFILKGASLLAVWLPDPYRATRDIDVLVSGSVSEDAIRALLEDICAVPCPGDALRFDLSELSLEPIRVDTAYVGKRARFRAWLGKSRIAVQLDLGVGDALTTPPEEIEYPRLLQTVPPARLRAYPREASIAEKFEAMVSLGTVNSRMKDFHDIWALAGAFPFDGRRLRTAVDTCFGRRGTPWTNELPPVLTPSFYGVATLEVGWRRYRAARTVLAPPPERFEQVGERIIEFLRPVRDSIVAREPFMSIWPAAGPWAPAAESEEPSA